MRTGCFLHVALALSGLSAAISTSPEPKVVRIPFEKQKQRVGWDASPDASRIRRQANVGNTALEPLDNKVCTQNFLLA